MSAQKFICYAFSQFRLPTVTVFSRKVGLTFRVCKPCLFVSGYAGQLAKFSTTVRHKRYPRIVLGKLQVMELQNTTIFKELFTPELVMLHEVFKKYGYEIRMAGGAVRDLVLNKKPEDIDFATTATPVQMKAMFENENIRMINMNGEKHGTITPRINDKENFEVTTLRIDVVTDGRHAEVKFTTDWELDAGRRDLTINSMFLDFEGKIFDYHNGIDDLNNRRVRFVGEAADRIQEDYLRILRYFRFYGKISNEPDNHEKSTMEAILANSGGLKQISGERIWVELRKLLSGNFAGPLMLRMLSLGIGQYIGLPEKPNTNEFCKLTNRLEELNLTVNPMTLISALLKDENEAMNLHRRLKLSAFERDLCLFVVLHREAKPCEIPIRPYQKLLIFSKSGPNLVRQWISEVLKYRCNVELLQEFESWVAPKFPIDGVILKENNVPPKLMAKVLIELKELWIDSNFTMKADELQGHIPEILDALRP